MFSHSLSFSRKSPLSLRANRGMSLAVSLVLLTSITLVAIYSMQRSNTQIKLIANMQHMEVARETVSSFLEAGIDQIMIDGSLLSRSIDSIQRDNEGEIQLDNEGNLQHVPIDPLTASQRPEVVAYLRVVSDMRYEGQSRISGSSDRFFSRYNYRQLGNASGDASGRLMSSQEVTFTYDGPVNQ